MSIKTLAILWTVVVDIPGDVMSAIATPGIPHLPLGPKFRLAAPGKVMHIDVMRSIVFATSSIC